MDSKTNTTEPQYPGFDIDFIATVTAADDTRLVKQTNFDCYHETYEHGIQRGTRMVYQIMAALEKMPDDGTSDGLVRSVIKEAADLSETEDRNKEKSLRGVAIGVLISIDELLVEVARTGLWRASMVKSLSSELEYLKFEHNAHVEATMNFMEKLGAHQIKPVEAPETETEKTTPRASGLSRKAIKELEGMEMHVRKLADLFQADGRVVDLLDYTADLYKWASTAPDSDTALSALVSAESFLHGAWAIVAGQEFDNAALADVLTSAKEKADKLSHSFDEGGAYVEKQIPAPRAAKKPAKQASRTAVAA